MKFKKFKAGDEVFSSGSGWVTLSLSDDPIYTLKSIDGFFTEEGKRWKYSTYPSIFDHNPLDPNDPKNPPVYRSDWPFMLNGRRVKLGDRLVALVDHGKMDHWIGDVIRLSIKANGAWAIVNNEKEGWTEFSLNKESVCWPDEIPKKKTTYLWAYPGYDVLGLFTVDFKRMTKEEGEKYAGAKIVPGTEEES